jgi:hypothetical protein
MTNKIAEKLSAALGIARLAKAAQTPHDFEAVVERARSELDAKRRLLASLEKRAESILLDGGDEVALYARISRTQDEVTTWRLNLAEAEVRRDAAATANYKADLEANMQSVLDLEVPGAEQALRDYHDAARAAADALDRYNAHVDAIKKSDATAKANDRPDLVIDASALRQRLGGELLGPHDESDKPVRGDEESDAAYSLRLQNWGTHKMDAARRDDPLRVAGEKAVAAIEAFIRPEGTVEASRGVRRMEVARYQTSQGPVRKIRPVDGLPSSGGFGPRP